MKILFDTHTFLWWDAEPERLTPNARTECADPENSLIVSVVSLWEIQIKVQLGKLSLRLPLADLVAGQVATNGVEILSVSLEHVLALDSLPPLHRDPFDRLLIAQPIVEDADFLSMDAAVATYPVRLLL